MATEKELLSARIFLRAVLPVIKVLLEDDHAVKKKFEDVRAKVQFAAGPVQDRTGAFLVFDKGVKEHYTKKKECQYKLLETHRKHFEKRR